MWIFGVSGVTRGFFLSFFFLVGGKGGGWSGRVEVWGGEMVESLSLT